jgi:5-methylthioadenosine/S-adenosylhomocysteine deaminase
MLFEKVAIIDRNAEVQTDMYVGVAGKYIDYVGRERPKQNYSTIIRGEDRLLTSGFFNAHGHAPMTLLRGYGEGLALSDWLTTRIFPFEAKMKGSDIYNGSMLAYAEMIGTGCVSSSDMYFFGDEMAAAIADSGIKGNFSLGTTCFDERSLRELPVYNLNQRMLSEYHNGADGRIRFELCIHGEYTSTPRIVSDMADLARETGLGVQIHLSETKDEHDGCKARHNKTPAQYFLELGLFDAPVTAAHCVWLEGEDFDILSQKNVTAAVCPASNLKLASGFANLPEMYRRGVPVALGIDGAASNNSLDMRADMKLLSLLPKAAFGDPACITPAQAFLAATRGGALAQGRDDCGVLAPGFRADLVMWKIDVASMQPVHSLLNNFVYSGSGSDACLTMVDGEVLYRDGVFLTLDIERVLHNAKASTGEILSRLQNS